MTEYNYNNPDYMPLRSLVVQPDATYVAPYREQVLVPKEKPKAELTAIHLLRDSLPNKNFSLFSRESLNRWIAKQEQFTIGHLADFDFVDLPAVDQYRHMIKAQPKQKLGK